MKLLYLDVKYITLYHTSVASFKLNNGSIYAKVVFCYQFKALKVTFLICNIQSI